MNNRIGIAHLFLFSVLSISFDLVALEDQALDAKVESAFRQVSACEEFIANEWTMADFFKTLPIHHQSYPGFKVKEQFEIAKKGLLRKWQRKQRTLETYYADFKGADRGNIGASVEYEASTLENCMSDIPTPRNREEL